MNRITNADIAGVVARYARIAKTLGFNVEGLEFQPGGPNTNVSYRLWIEGNYAAPGTSNGYLGETKREAYNTIYTLCLAFEDVYWKTSGDKS